MQETDAPVIVATKRLMAANSAALSLAQGVVHWPPPPGAVEAGARALAAGGPAAHGYGPAEGLPALREALRRKIRDVNGLEGVSGWRSGRGSARWRA